MCRSVPCGQELRLRLRAEAPTEIRTATIGIPRKGVPYGVAERPMTKPGVDGLTGVVGVEP
jgi:hypothetical protein